MKAKKRILYATDFSEAAEPAFAYALAAAAREDGTLILVHVIEPHSPLADELAVAEDGSARDVVDGTVRKQFDALLARAKGADVPAHDRLACGRPADEIVNTARNEFADLIVMGTHGRTGLKRLVLGSVAQEVVASAPCPVLTVRMKEPLT